MGESPPGGRSVVIIHIDDTSAYQLPGGAAQVAVYTRSATARQFIK
jgi:hypothetical protein